MSGYDERLLANAPVATRAEKQEGYNIDLLDEHKPAGIRSTSTTPPPVPALSPDASRAETGGYANSTRGGYSSVAASTKPWYKTRKWLIIFLIAAIVVIAAVVGGAVGGTVGHHSNSSAVASSTNPAAGQESGGGGEAASNTIGIGMASTSTSGGSGTNAPGGGQSASRSSTSPGGPPGQTSGPPGVGVASTETGNSPSAPTAVFAAGVGSQ
ncbi:hypothetical protein OH76DRAFT_1407333 [Lentinus brumalis]|uniref:Uncharacterized protein n=1 Tax=Lentinus brumalis TaxID=2498619 RepID=A0A371D0C9_9APHY|nr:hypothetical protein OH76DRAFT_1407333 [Polyporus brumalis]